ncbi:MAG: carbon starvation protein A [Thermoanaerobaculia bacterium]|nr:carbon starvation protein A [Thermoanaerobaculia bacterium]
MKAIFIALVGLAAFALGYRFYARFLAERIFRLDPEARTPAHELSDGTDFVATNKHVLWGHHFTSVAGAAPIVGPAIAVFWGWVPALLWVLLGTIFFAGVHDFGTLWISAKHKGRSIGSLTGDVVSGRSRTLFMLVIFLLLLMVNAVFAIVIARLFVTFPGSVVPIWFEIPLAMLIGWIVVRRGKKLLWPSIAALIALYVVVWYGAKIPVVLPESILGLPPAGFWVIILFVYAWIASRLPVWLLLQPRDFINSHQLIVGLGVLYIGLVIGNPTVAAPALNPDPIGAPPLIPILFITIACGAISGFHGLVSSGTSSKQLDRETDARFVGYMGAVGEGALALGSIIVVTAGIAATRAEWLSTFYQDWGSASGGAAGFFVAGLARMAEYIGIPVEVGQVFASVIVVSFAATTMDTGVRLQRYIITELGEQHSIPALGNHTLSTSLAVGSCLLLAFGAHAPGGGVGSGGLVIWPLFGTTNQLLAALSLIVIAVYLRRLGRSIVPVVIPMVFLLTVTVWAMTTSVGRWLLGDTPNYLMGLMGLVVLLAAIWMTLEAWSALREPATLETER